MNPTINDFELVGRPQTGAVEENGVNANGGYDVGARRSSNQSK
jgi:hypothetical protein